MKTQLEKGQKTKLLKTLYKAKRLICCNATTYDDAVSQFSYLIQTLNQDIIPPLSESILEMDYFRFRFNKAKMPEPGFYADTNAYWYRAAFEAELIIQELSEYLSLSEINETLDNCIEQLNSTVQMVLKEQSRYDNIKVS